VQALLAVVSKVRELAAKLGAKQRLEGERDDLKRKQELLRTTDFAKTLDELRRRRQEARGVESIIRDLDTFAERLKRAAEPVDLTIVETGADDPGQALAQSVEAMNANLQEINAGATKLAGSIVELRDGWQRELKSSSWQKAVDLTELAYAEVVRVLKEQGVADPGEYGRVLQQRQDVEGRLAALVSAAEERERQKTEVDRLKAIVWLSRLELTKRRRTFLARVLESNPYIEIEVIPFGDRAKAARDVRDLLGVGERFERDVPPDGKEGIWQPLYEPYQPLFDGERSPMDADITTFQDRLNQLKKWLGDIARGQPVTPSPSDNRFTAHLKAMGEERLDTLRGWYPEDSLRVRYRATEASPFRPIDQGSPGQKTAALLSFLLSYGTEPLILDQPEDDLDNELIYDLIVQELRNIKARRQVIVVTHNPNIVVNGDAELVVTLTFAGGQTHANVGGLQEERTREDVCRVMEGGRDAFKQRYRRLTERRDVR